MLNGHLLGDRYQIKETIGGGGMANVYLATDTILHREVAIKVLRLEYANDEEFIARFDREAKSATSLSHPNIVNIFDVGEEDHILYMVMEYVDGMTLKEYIQRNGPLDVEEAINIMKQITSAISHAHENGIVHRDIKPQNILIDTYGQVKVTDFGIAIALSATALTQTNSILGSVHYLSPEQARGGMATKKSDIYSLGIVFFELLTGRLPFSGQSPVSIALKHLQSETPSIRQSHPEIPQSVENIVLQATAKDPFHRYRNVEEMEYSLVHALDSSNLHVEKFAPPVEEGAETKAIPIITDDQLHGESNGDTIVHHADSETIKVPDDPKAKPAKGKKAKKSKKVKEKKPKKKNKKKKWLIILLIIFLLLVAGVAALFIIPGIMKPKDVTVPDVTELEYSDAVDELAKYKLEAERELVWDEEIEEGLVVKTDPRPGRTAKEGDTVTVFVSQGKEQIEFKDYVGEDFNQIKRLLEDDYIEVISYEKHSDRPEGEIIGQIQPSPGTKVIPSETKVIFEVSSGPELISLNNLKGMTEKEVRDYLDRVGLHMNMKEENSDTVPKGEVIQQKPAANTQLEKNETIEVVFSIGPKELPPATREITVKVPYNPKEEPEEGEDPIEQNVKIYIGDMDHSITDVYKEEKITEDGEFTFTLTIAPNSHAEYKVLRDDEVIIDKTEPYKEGE